MKLDCGKMTIWTCGDGAIDEFVNHHYGFYRGPWQAKVRHQGFMLAAYDGVTHDDILSFDVEPIAMEPDELKDFVDSNGEDLPPIANDIFNDLCHKGVMEPGKYHVWIA